MQIRNYATGATYAGSLTETVSTEIAKLALGVKIDAITIADLDELLTEFSATKVSVSLWRNGQNLRIYSNVPLTAIAEFDTANEGVLFVESDANIREVYFPIPVSMMGAVDLDGESQIKVDITGLPTAATWQFALFGVQSPVLDTSVISMVQATAQADHPSYSVAVSDYSQVLIPIADVLSVNIDYSNGRGVEFTADELKLAHAATNDAFVISRGSAGAGTFFGMGGHYQYAVLDITGAVRVRVDKLTSGSAVLFFVGETQVGDVDLVNSVNSQLIDTTIGQ